LLEGEHDALQGAAFLAEFLGALGVVPDFRVFEELGNFGQAFLFAVVVKDTSEVLRFVGSGRKDGWR